MASRFGQNKPDPAIKRNVRDARLRAQKTRGEGTLVVAGSVAATVCAWALLAAPAPAAINTGSLSQAAAPALQAVVTQPQVQNTGGIAWQVDLPPVATPTSTSQSGVTAGARLDAPAPRALALTRSSR